MPVALSWICHHFDKKYAPYVSMAALTGLSGLLTFCIPFRTVGKPLDDMSEEDLTARSAEGAGEGEEKGGKNGRVRNTSMMGHSFSVREAMKRMRSTIFRTTLDEISLGCGNTIILAQKLGGSK